MRHLWSLLAGVVAAPLTWVLVSMGQGGSTRTVTGWLETRRYDTIDLIEPAAYLAVAGIVLGLLGTLRFSPLGPLVAGLLLIGPYAGMFADPFTVRDAVPGDWKVLGDPLPLRLPLDNGTLLLIGALLVMATFSVQRWRRWPGTPAASTPESPESSGPLDSLSSDSGEAVTVATRSGAGVPLQQKVPADAPAAGTGSTASTRSAVAAFSAGASAAASGASGAPGASGGSSGSGASSGSGGSFGAGGSGVAGAAGGSGGSGGAAGGSGGAGSAGAAGGGSAGASAPAEAAAVGGGSSTPVGGGSAADTVVAPRRPAESPWSAPPASGSRPTSD